MPNPAAKLEKRAAVISLTVGILLLLIKFIAYLLTGSTAIFSDALEGIVNVLASCFALYAVIVSHQPADRDHPYGHGKIEFLSASFEGGMMILAAVMIVVQAVLKLIHVTPVEKIDSGLLLMAIAMLGNGLVGLYLVRSGRKTGSIALEADGHHLLSDAVTSAAVIVALVLIQMTARTWIDPAMALVVAAYIFWTAGGLLRRSSAGLMDEQDRGDDATIRGILDTHIGPDGKLPHICSYHKLRHRHSGRYHWVDFHLVVPPQWDVDQGHRVASSIEYEIEQAIGEGNATAHVEPCKTADCPMCRLKPLSPELDAGKP